jgi:hypothetical protein
MKALLFPTCEDHAAKRVVNTLRRFVGSERAGRWIPSGTVTIQDCLFLSVVVLLSAILYIHNLGFYSDDWSFLGFLSMSPDQSISGLFRSIYSPHVKMRPLQILYLAVLYKLFGPHPLGYHLFNTVILLSNVELFYLALRELGQRRILSLAVPLLYGLFPLYSTDRFWVAAFQANLSMALYFLCLYSDLRAVRARQTRLWYWRLLSVMSLLGSSMAYEVTLPLFALNPLLVWCRARQFDSSDPGRRWVRTHLATSLASTLLALTLAVAFKALTTIRLGNQTGNAQYFLSIVRRAIALDYGEYDYGLNLKQAILVNYGEYGLGLPRIAWKILQDYPDAAISTVGGFTGLIIFGHLYHVASKSDTELISKQCARGLIALGPIVFVLGYAVFLTNYNVLFTTTGIGNRTAIAAAIGVALSLVGALGWLSNLLPSDRLRKHAFCALVALLCTASFLITNTIASFWERAYRQETEILNDIHRQFPSLPEGCSLILDGVCPYVGPAIVFESSWDLAGALLIHYRDYTLRADVVTPSLKIREDGLYTSLYEIEHHYPYDNMFIYNYEQKVTYRLTSAEDAHRYFQAINPAYKNACPQGHAGYGVPLF